MNWISGDYSPESIPVKVATLSGNGPKVATLKRTRWQLCPESVATFAGQGGNFGADSATKFGMLL